jgi:hypothetical protein
MHHAILVIHVKDDGRRRSVQKVNAPLPSLPLQDEPAHAASGNPNQIVVTVAERKENQIDQPLTAPFEVAAKSQ